MPEECDGSRADGELEGALDRVRTLVARGGAAALPVRCLLVTMSFYACYRLGLLIGHLAHGLLRATLWGA